MVTLSRSVRFAVNPPNPLPGNISASDHADSNGFAGVPAMQGLGRFYELEVCCSGEPDPATGYFLDIKFIDRAARLTLVPAISAACRDTPHAAPQHVLAPVMASLSTQLKGTLRSVRWNLSPYYSVELTMQSPTSFGPTALVRQRFEIAAAHRLNAPSLSADKNRLYFGKCNNTSGHGHNYIIEPCISVPLGPSQPGSGFTISQLERLVDQAIIQPYDHKHLNLDTPAFNQNHPGGVNPSVENIAKVFFEALAPLITSTGAALHSVRVWETEKTSASYPQ